MSVRADAHLAAFNAAVRSGRWDEFAERFAPEARMEFVGVPAGPFEGRDAIAAAYQASPPDDTMTAVGTRSDGDVDVVRFCWDHGGTGSMRLRWTADGAVAQLSVTFD